MLKRARSGALGGHVARTPQGQWRASSPAARRVPVTVPVDETISARADRMARFAAGARQIVRRASAIGGLLAAGWLLAIVFGLLGAAPAAANTTAEAGAARSGALDTAASGSALQADDFPTGSGVLSATDTAEAMAGRGVDGLTSQSKPGSPAPATVDHSSGSNGSRAPDQRWIRPLRAGSGGCREVRLRPAADATARPSGVRAPPCRPHSGGRSFLLS